MTKAKDKTRIVAKLNDQNVLVGSTVIDADGEGIDFGDLPTNGTYKWDREREHFVPLGHGFGKVKTREPYEPSLIMATLIDTLEKNGISLPEPLVVWRDWYNQEMRRRHEELSTRPK